MDIHSKITFKSVFLVIGNIDDYATANALFTLNNNGTV